MNKQPLVSILMTAYNREKYIAEAIESVLASTYKNFELIIVDDGSTDTTVQIIQQYQTKNAHIKLFVNPQNLGDYPNRNKAVSYAKGEYFIFVDSDDKTFIDSFEYLVTSMLVSPEADMGMLCRDTFLCNRVLQAKDSINYHFFKNQILIIGPGGTIIKTDFFKTIGNYPTQYGPANDMYFNLKAASLGSIKFLCKEFLYYRIHAGQEANNKFGYIYHNYNYFNDAFQNLNLFLSLSEKKSLYKKNKRRLLVNTAKLFYKYKKLSEVKMIIKKTNFTVKDFFNAVFN